MAPISELVRQCKVPLESHYGSQLKGLILYGSLAGSQADSMSDLDLLFLLRKSLDCFFKLRQIIEILYSIQLELERLISAKPVPSDEFEQGRIQPYRNAKREGLVI